MDNTAKILTKHNGRLLLCLGIFFFLRIIWVYFQGWQEIPSGSDAISYNGYALAILNQPDWLSNPSFLGDYRPLGYPLFLALIYSIFGVQNLLAVYIFQAIIGTLTVYYIFKLSSSIFGERKSFLSLFWAGFYFFYLWHTGMILRETLVFFLIIFSFYHLWVFFQSEESFHCLRNRNLWVFIIAYTALFFTDAKYFFYVPFLAIFFVVYRGFRIGIKEHLWVLLMMMFFLIPWTIRNYIAYDAFVLINTRTFDARSHGVKSNLSFMMPHKTTYSVKSNCPSEEERILIKAGENPNNRTPEEIEIIKKDVYPPSTYLGGKIYRFKEMWIPFRTWSDYEGCKVRGPWSMRHNLVSIICYGTLMPFALISVFYLYKTRNSAIWFLLLPIVIHAILHFPISGRARYRMPIDAFVIILGCYGMIIIYDLIRRREIPNNS